MHCDERASVCPHWLSPGAHRIAAPTLLYTFHSLTGVSDAQELSEARDSHREAEARRAEAEAQRVDMEARCAAAEAMCKNERALAAETESQAADSRSVSEVLERENDRTKADLAEASRRIAAFEETLKAARAAVRKLASELAEVQERGEVAFDEPESGDSKLDPELLLIRAELQQLLRQEREHQNMLVSERDAALAEGAEALAKLREVEKTAEATSFRKEALEEVEAERHQTAAKLNEALVARDRLEAEVESLRAQFVGAKGKLDASVAAMKVIEEQLKESRSQHSRSKKAADVARGVADAVRQQAQKLDAEVASLKSVLAKAEERESCLNAKLENMVQNVERLEGANKELQLEAQSAARRAAEAVLERDASNAALLHERQNRGDGSEQTLRAMVVKREQSFAAEREAFEEQIGLLVSASVELDKLKATIVPERDALAACLRELAREADAACKGIQSLRDDAAGSVLGKGAVPTVLRIAAPDDRAVAQLQARLTQLDADYQRACNVHAKETEGLRKAAEAAAKERDEMMRARDGAQNEATLATASLLASRNEIDSLQSAVNIEKRRALDLEEMVSLVQEERNAALQHVAGAENAARGREDDAQQSVQATREHRDLLRNRISKLESELEEMKHELSCSKSEASLHASSLLSYENQMIELKSENALLQTRYQTQTRAYEEASHMAASAQRDAAELSKDVKEARRHLKDQVAELMRELEGNITEKRLAAEAMQRCMIGVEVNGALPPLVHSSTATTSPLCTIIGGALTAMHCDARRRCRRKSQASREMCSSGSRRCWMQHALAATRFCPRHCNGPCGAKGRVCLGVSAAQGRAKRHLCTDCGAPGRDFTTAVCCRLFLH